LAAESIPSCAYKTEPTFDIFNTLTGGADDDFDQAVHGLPTDTLKEMLTEAVQTLRNYAIPGGDRFSEAALHAEINLMLDELRTRGAM
jgi:hypothetical protein